MSVLSRIKQEERILYIQREQLWVKCLAQGHVDAGQPGIEPSTLPGAPFLLCLFTTVAPFRPTLATLV